MTKMKTGFYQSLLALNAAIITMSLSAVAHAAPVLNAVQDKAVHSYDGSGCQDIDSKRRDGRLRAGSCVEFQIQIQNMDKTTKASAINFKNPVDQDLIFIAAFVDGFAGGVLDIPKANTDCGKETCLVVIQDASIAPQKTGTLKIRAVVK